MKYDYKYRYRYGYMHVCVYRLSARLSGAPDHMWFGKSTVSGIPRLSRANLSRSTRFVAKEIVSI